MFIAVVFIIANPTKCPSVGEWLNKLWCIHNMEYKSAIKRAWTIKTHNNNV